MKGGEKPVTNSTIYRLINTCTQVHAATRHFKLSNKYTCPYIIDNWRMCLFYVQITTCTCLGVRLMHAGIHTVFRTMGTCAY